MLSLNATIHRCKISAADSRIPCCGEKSEFNPTTLLAIKTLSETTILQNYVKKCSSFSNRATVFRPSFDNNIGRFLRILVGYCKSL